MRISSFRHSAIPGLGVVLLLAFSSCNQISTTVTASEPTLTMTSQQNAFRKGDKLTVQLEIYSPTDSEVNVLIGASDKIGLTKNSFQETLQAGQHKTIELQGTIKRSGYYNITANATSNVWHEPVTTIFGFNAQSNDVQRAAINTDYPQSASGPETLEAHLDSLPKIKTLDAYSKLSTDQTIDDAKDLDAVRLDARLENLQFEKRDGTKTEPFNTVLNYLPDTGSGQPRPEDLIPPTAAQKAKVKPRGIGCGASTTATVHATISYNYSFTANGITFGTKKTQILPNTKIIVWDENPWLQPSVIAVGYTDQFGDFRFQKPDCDWGAWWDYSGPDIFFSVESVDNHAIGAWNILAPIYNSTYSAFTGTNWDTTSNSFAVDLTANNSDSEHAIWLYRMVQMAQDFNVGAGGAGGTYFPMRIAWPSRTLGITPYSFAPYGKLEIMGSEWIFPYIAWHEFGHEMMYRTSTPNQFLYAYNQGAFSIGIPAFAWGGHDYQQRENVELAYNEGFANYFYIMLQDYYQYNFNTWVGAEEDRYFRKCNNSLCSAYASGNENESRVSTFLYRYTNEVLYRPISINPNNTVSAQQAFGLVRSSLWNVGYYSTNLTDAWKNWLKITLPLNNSAKITTKNIASDTYFTLDGLQ